MEVSLRSRSMSKMWCWCSRRVFSMALMMPVKNHRAMKGVMIPIRRLRPEARPEAVGLAM